MTCDGRQSAKPALFRVTEASAGALTIDGIDVSRIGLHDLRFKVTMIPQKSLLFSGSIRDNLDCGRYEQGTSG